MSIFFLARNENIFYKHSFMFNDKATYIKLHLYYELITFTYLQINFIALEQQFLERYLSMLEHVWKINFKFRLCIQTYSVQNSLQSLNLCSGQNGMFVVQFRVFRYWLYLGNLLTRRNYLVLQIKQRLLIKNKIMMICIDCIKYCQCTIIGIWEFIVGSSLFINQCLQVLLHVMCWFMYLYFLLGVVKGSLVSRFIR
eukprot:TRINITY_DN6189_c0_g1_i1.p2 TRINITY_DN6189_c0_g1~~TRINITY_DN6189_c0_g1_i1.p2  ORF type:complete len:197 (-),score=-13.33 TRINITY_DN6189_c0_g1_i1:136-726(-)